MHILHRETERERERENHFSILIAETFALPEQVGPWPCVVRHGAGSEGPSKLRMAAVWSLFCVFSTS